MQNKMKKYDLWAVTLNQLKLTETPLLIIALAADVSSAMLFRWKRGDYAQPDVFTVQKLHDYFLTHPKDRGTPKK